MGNEQKEKDELKKDPIKAEPKKQEQGTPDKDQREQLEQQQQKQKQIDTELANKQKDEPPVVTLNDNKPDGPEHDKGPKAAQPLDDNGLNTAKAMLSACFGLGMCNQILGIASGQPGQQSFFNGLLSSFGIEVPEKTMFDGKTGHELAAQNDLDTRPDLAPGMNNTNKPGLGQGPGGIG